MAKCSNFSEIEGSLRLKIFRWIQYLESVTVVIKYIQEKENVF